MRSTTIPVSILDRANARAGSTESDVLRGTIARARRAENSGYRRFWVAEHHGVPGIAGSAPTVLMAALAAGTDAIRIGCGGVMLPNHQPLVVAEQAATLHALYPGRIDLGIGRSVGFTPAVRSALRQGKDAAERFEEDVSELLAYLSGGAAITARPRDHGSTPLFVLATGKGVDIAARAGLAVVVGGPALFRRGAGGTPPVLERYRRNFQPSRWYSKPYVIASANVMVAGSTAEARQLLLPEAWALARSRTRGEFGPLAPPAELAEDTLTDRERALVEESLAASMYGTTAEVAGQVDDLLSATGADELLATGTTFDPGAQAEADAALAAVLRT